MLELEERLAEYGAYLDGLAATVPDTSSVRDDATSDAGMRSRPAGHRTPPRGLVAVCVLLIGVASIVGAIALSRDDDTGFRIATPASEPREVSVEQLPRSATGLFVYFVVDATDEQVSSVQAVLDSSPDVVHYAFLDHDAAHVDFSQLYACHPDLVQSVSPVDLPVSFRVSTTDADAAARIQIALGNAPGVQLVDTRTTGYGIPARSDQTVTPDLPAPCDVRESALPDRILVSGSDGDFAGYADRGGRPDYAAFPNDPEAAASAWLHTPIPVTRTADPSSELVGYLFPTVGVIDLATYNSPSFDLDARLAEAAAEQDRLVQGMKDAGVIP